MGEEHDRWEALIEGYLQQFETSSEISEQTSLLRQIAHVFDSKLGDQAQAYDALVAAFELDVDDDETVSYLEKMAAATKRWVPLVQLTNRWLQGLGAQDSATQISLCLRLAKWYGEDLDRPDYALPYHHKVLSLDPANVQVMRLIANHHKKNADWMKQGHVLEQALKLAARGADRAALLTDMGELLEKSMDNAELSLVHYTRALQADPYYLPALNSLETIYETKGQHANLVDVLRAKAQSLDKAKRPDEAAIVRLKLARHLESSLGQPELAIGVYQEVLDYDPGNLTAIKGLERIHGATER